MGLFLHKVYRLMSEKGLTYSEACREVGKHGTRRKRAIRKKHARWIPAKPVDSKPVHVEPSYPPAPKPEHHLEQTYLDFN